MKYLNRIVKVYKARTTNKDMLFAFVDQQLKFRLQLLINQNK